MKSPCIDLCRFDGSTGWCRACAYNREQAAVDLRQKGGRFSRSQYVTLTVTSSQH
ncbi:DUF1289 domain-containing protein [Rhizorhabdus dicambivorans]|uniref:DUF1289 domain-containing protein n=1 Tax=Rhizorhabdus dicambivorans TaxID=1850238 RepID=A0A2A4FQ54_9SPHN|nr:DUF1289 domain-containing protein [Rhizorhabdus dicambivorans]PCE40307.1 DUF1289 domain-containing protein [Rhizorhabdus dicambivorans]